MQVTKRGKRTDSKNEGGRFERSPCPIACTLDLVGDKWSLLVIRDMLDGEVTYGKLVSSPEGIPTNILADRLRRLECAGLIAKSAYQERPTRYAYGLTEKGKALREVLRALVQWGEKYIPGTRARDSAERGTGAKRR